jgi:hypothetical protein
LEPVKLKTEILQEPRIFKQNTVIKCDEITLRKLPIQKPVDLPQDSWLLIYSYRNYEQANAVYDTMTSSCKQLNIAIGEPHWIELS